MNIYKVLNEITLFIDEHIEEKIDYEVLSKMMGVNTYTMQRIFSVITGIPLAEYIRKRKLSCAAFDLITNNYKIMDLAIKYNYENATSFSRAFEAFHNVLPSEVTKDTKLKEFPRIIFNEDVSLKSDIEYLVVTLKELTLYGMGIGVNNETISSDAPSLCEKAKELYGEIDYAMVTYKDLERTECNSYYVLYKKKIEGLELIKIPESKWLCFVINSKNAKDIQEMSHKFYEEFLPSCKFNLRDLPELEYYHDGITEFLVPIY